MTHMITVKTQEDFEDLVRDRNFEISSAITKSIIKNLKGKRKNVPILSIKVLEEQIGSYIASASMQLGNSQDTIDCGGFF